jgi:hypothetical protein
MAGTTLSIKLRCGSWQQLATIYRRDLSRGTMFLKASTQPPLGTIVKIDLELPSETIIELTGTIIQHVVDPQRGTGVDLKLEPLATKTVWLIESALAAENKVRAGTEGGVQPAPPPGDSAITDGENVAEAEAELIRALEAEAESLRKLNPFLVLGVGYETTDNDVRAAFGELTKRYHPDRFARYQSTKLRQIAAEIFILIRDAYRRLADDASRTSVRASLSLKAPRAVTAPGGRRTPPQGVARVPPPIPKSEADPPARHGPHDAPTSPSNQSAAIASTQIAKPSDIAPPHVVDRKSGPVRIPPALTTPLPPSQQIERPRTGALPVIADDASAIEIMIDEGRLEEALAAYRVAVKKNAQDRTARAGIELVEGMKALAQRDRLEAAQRFEATLEIDPSNERAARELADMRRQATNERKGLLSRLMGKKEGPP